MAALFYSSPRARFFDSNGNPLSLGSVEFYFAGTSTLKEIYTDNTGASPAQNPQPLDIEGYVRDGGVWLGEGLYDVVLKDENDVTIWTMPNVEGANAGPSGNVGDIAFIGTINDLLNLDTSVYSAAYVFGYYSNNDGGQGWFLFDDSSTQSPDGGAVIAPLGTPATGRWLRQFEEDHFTLPQWGACESAPGSVDANLAAAWQWMTVGFRSHQTMYVPKGTITLLNGFDFSGANNTLILEGGAKFECQTPGETITISCGHAEGDGVLPMVDAATNLAWLPRSSSDAYAEWWGVGAGNIGDALSKINAVNRVVFSLAYNIVDKTTPGSYTVDRAHFTFGSTMNVDSAVAPVRFENATFEKNAVDVFTGLANDSLYFNTEIPVRVFQGALTDNAAYLRMLQSVTYGNVRTGQLLWDLPEVMSVSAGYNLASHDIYSRFENARITIGPVTETFIGTVTNGPDYIIDQATTNVPIMVNSKHQLGWYGISSVDTPAGCAKNINALQKSATGLTNLGSVGLSAVVDGGSANIYINDVVTLTTPLYSLESAIIRESSAWLGGGAGTDFIKVNGAAQFKDTSIIAVSASDLPDIEVSGSTSWTDSGTNFPVRLTNTSDHGIEGCDFAFVPDIAATQASLTIGDGVTATINNIHITNTKFNSPIVFSGASGWLADNIQFMNNTSAASAKWIEVGGAAAIGHTSCVVKDNKVGGGNWVGTEIVYLISPDVGTPPIANAYVEANFNTTQIIFKQQQTPINSSICYDLGESTVVLTAPMIETPHTWRYDTIGSVLRVGWQKGNTATNYNARVFAQWNNMEISKTATYFEI